MRLGASHPVDRKSFDEGQFASGGGYARWNEKFDGEFEALLGELADEIWAGAGAA